VFVQRHHAMGKLMEYTPPHLIDHVAIWKTLKLLNVQLVIGVCSVGTLKPDVLPVGTLLVCDDWLAPYTLPAHVKSDAHYKPMLDAESRSRVLDILKSDPELSKVLCSDPAVYVQTSGPRFETRAEIRALARDADVVGMTAASEASLACELGIKYVMLCMVDNCAHGLDNGGADSSISSMEAFKKAQAANVARVERAVALLVEELQKNATLASNNNTPMKRVKQISELQVETLIRARYVATVNQSDLVINHGLVAIDASGCIVGVHAETESPLPAYTARNVIHLPDSLLAPGLINAHTHVGMTLMRGFGDDLALTDWLTTRIWPAETKLASPSFVYDSTSMACSEMLQSGTTTFSEMYFFPEATEQAVLDAGIRAVVGLVVIDFPTPMSTGGDDCLEKAHGMLFNNPSVLSSGLVTYSISPHAPYSVSETHMVFFCLLAIVFFVA